MPEYAKPGHPFIPQPTGQILSFRTWEDFLAWSNGHDAALTQAAVDAGIIPPKTRPGESGPGDAYTCARCGGVFTRSRTDDDALAESDRLFSGKTPGERPADLVLICDGCFKFVMERLGVN